MRPQRSFADTFSEFRRHTEQIFKEFDDLHKRLLKKFDDFDMPWIGREFGNLSLPSFKDDFLLPSLKEELIPPSIKEELIPPPIKEELTEFREPKLLEVVSKPVMKSSFEDMMQFSDLHKKVYSK